MFEAIIYDPVNNRWPVKSNGLRVTAPCQTPGCFTRGRLAWCKSPHRTTGWSQRTTSPCWPVSPRRLRSREQTWACFEPTTLTANLLDSRGNRMAGPSTMVWDIDGVYAGLGEPTWTADELGEVHARVRYNQLEARATLTATAGAPHAFVFDEPLTVRAGSSNPSPLDWSTSTGMKCRSPTLVPWRGLLRTARSTPKVSTSPRTRDDGSFPCHLETSPGARPSMSSPGTQWPPRS